MIKNKHKNMIKGFVQLSRAWYGKTILENCEYTDRVTFGFYSPEGGATGEMSVEWIDLLMDSSGRKVPLLNVFSDAWSALANMHDLIDLLGEHDGEDLTPEHFCECLIKCGFVDRTQTEFTEWIGGNTIE